MRYILSTFDNTSSTCQTIKSVRDAKYLCVSWIFKPFNARQRVFTLFQGIVVNVKEPNSNLFKRFFAIYIWTLHILWSQMRRRVTFLNIAKHCEIATHFYLTVTVVFLQTGTSSQSTRKWANYMHTLTLSPPNLKNVVWDYFHVQYYIYLLSGSKE